MFPYWPPLAIVHKHVYPNLYTLSEVSLFSRSLPCYDVSVGDDSILRMFKNFTRDHERMSISKTPPCGPPARAKQFRYKFEILESAFIILYCLKSYNNYNWITQRTNSVYKYQVDINMSILPSWPNGCHCITLPNQTKSRTRACIFFFNVTNNYLNSLRDL